jgi:outer membrane receptor protein involved in Fe transport
MPGYTTYDGSFGIGKDQWNVEVFGQNLSDENSSTYTSAVQFVVTQTVLRPRVFGVRMSYKFSDK